METASTRRELTDVIVMLGMNSMLLENALVSSASLFLLPSTFGP